MTAMSRALAGVVLSLSMAACMSSGNGGGDEDDDDTDIGVIGADPVAGTIDAADNTEQVYGFAAPADGVYRVALTWAEAQSDLDLLVTDGDENYFTLAANAPAESINVALVQGSIIAIAVSAFRTSGAQAYTLSVAATGLPAHAPGQVESEPNDNALDAHFIGFGQVSGIVQYDLATMSGSDEYDHFFYVAPASATYTVRLTWSSAQSDLDLGIVFPGGNATSEQANTTAESIDQPFAEGDQIDIIVFAFDTGGVAQPYSLVIEQQ